VDGASAAYRLLADAVLVMHVGVVLFVVGGLILVLLGNLRHWPWVNGWWFRLAHLAAIGVVAAQAWLGVVCPLTTLEMWLRARSGDAVYAGSFIQHWLERALYHDAPGWVFTLAYSVFAAAVLAVWWRFPPGSCVERQTI
jgi:hypothetical protein